MTKEEAKYRADIYAAYADGKQIECKAKYNQKGWMQMAKDEGLNFTVFQYRVKPTPKTRRMTNQELADWLRNESQEHREIKKRGCGDVYQQLAYMEIEADKECGDVLIRRDHGEWEEPIIKMEE